MEPTTSPKTEKEIIDQILKEKKFFEQSTVDQRKEIRDIYSAYLGKMDEVKPLPYKNHETIPKLRTEVAYVKPFIFSGQPEFEVEGVGDEDKFIAQILEKIVNYRLSQSIKNAYEKIEGWVHQATTFGTSVINVVWKTETKETPQMDEMGQPMMDENGEQMVITEIVRDEPDLEVPNILDVYFNPIIAEVHEQPSLLFRSILPVEYVKECTMYNYVDADGNLNRQKVESKKIVDDSYNSTSQKTDVANAYEHQDGMVEIIERVSKNRIMTIALGQNLVLRDITNRYGFINSVKFAFEKNTIPNRFAGMGVGHNTMGLGKLIYKLFNQILDSIALSNNPMFLFKKGSVGDASKLVGKPGGGVPVDAENIRDAITPIIFPDIKDGAFKIAGMLDDEHKRASGANDLLQGSASNGTLGQDQIAQQNISNRFELVQRRFRQALADVGEMIIKMELQNLQSPDAEILRIFPEEMRQSIYKLLISEAQDIKYNINVRGETTVARNKEMESKRLVEIFNLSQNFLTDDEKRAFMRRIAERQGEQNIDEIIAEKAPMQPMMGQMPNQEIMGGVGANDNRQSLNQNL